MSPVASAVPPPVTVLVVDDNPEVLFYIESYLQDCDYIVSTATNAPDALVMMRSGYSPKVLVSDIVMPGAIDGLGLARQVKTEFPEIGILLITGWSYDDDHNFPVFNKPVELSNITQWITDFTAH